MEADSNSPTLQCCITKIIKIHLISNILWKKLSLRDLKSCCLVNKLWHSTARDFMQKNLRLKFKIQKEFPCQSLKEFDDFLSSSEAPAVSSLFSAIESPRRSGRELVKCVGTVTELHNKILLEGEKVSALFPALISKLELKHFHFSTTIGTGDSERCPVLDMLFKELLWINAGSLESIEMNGVKDEDYQSFLYGKKRDETEPNKNKDLPVPVFQNLKRLELSNSKGLQRDLKRIVGSAPNLRVIHGLLEASILGQESILPQSLYPLLKELIILLTWLKLSQLHILITNPVIGIAFLDLFCRGYGEEDLDERFSHRRWVPGVTTLLEQQAGRLLSLSCTVPQLRIICRDSKVPLGRLSSLTITVGPTEGFFVSVHSALKSIPNFAAVLPNLSTLSITAETVDTMLETGTLETSDLCEGSMTLTQCPNLCSLSLSHWDSRIDVSRLATGESFLSLTTAIPNVTEFSCTSGLFLYLSKELKQCIPWDLSKLTLFQVELDLLLWESLFHCLKPGLSSMHLLIVFSSDWNPLGKYAEAEDGYIIPWFSSQLAQDLCTPHPGLEISVTCFTGQSIARTSFDHLGPSATAERIDRSRYRIRLSGTATQKT